MLGLLRLGTAKTEKEAHGEFESEHLGYCGAQDTFYSVAELTVGQFVLRRTWALGGATKAAWLQI